MPYVRLPGGIVAHVKMAKPRRHQCSASGRHGIRCGNVATFQCDYPLGGGKTCDAWCCRVHATSVGPDLDHCPVHAGHQASLFTGLIP